MKKITKYFTFLLVFSCLLSYAQGSLNFNHQNETRDRSIRCSSDEYNDKLRKDNPNLMKVGDIDKIISRYNDLRVASPQEPITRIPVVVHVIHNGESIGVGPNISDAQVLSQIQVLNEDFRKQIGTNGYNTDPVGADTGIEFYLAKEDPNCNPTSGIERIDYSATTTSWSGPNGNTDSVLKPETVWDPGRYLNIWTVVFSDPNNLGYAQLPGGQEMTDGVVISHDVFGSNAASGVNIAPPFNLGRTTTHEVGHFLGLFHTFDGLSCSGQGDGIDDTPQTSQENFGCPAVAPDSCPADPGDDMIENYLDYSDDVCMNIFTQGQSMVMNAVLNDANRRLSLANSNVADTPLPNVTYDGSILIENLNQDNCSGIITPEVKLGNYGTRTLNSASITYTINGGANQVFSWTGSLAQGETEIIVLPNLVPPAGSNSFQVSVSQSNTDQRTCNDVDSAAFFGSTSYTDTNMITLTLTTDDFSTETSWEFRNSNGDILYNDSYNGGSDDNTTFTEIFNVVNNECYTFTIFDSENDGICCGFGNGSYELRTDDNTLIFSGGQFGLVESTQISTQTLSTPNFFDNNAIRVFPNPATTELNIRIGTNNELADGFEIYNMLGQAIMRREINSMADQKINISAIGDGMYFIKILKQGSNISVPFIKK